MQVLAQGEDKMSTVIGARRKIIHSSPVRTPLCNLPFDEDKIIKHFLYHILPLGGEHEWALRKNIEQVCQGLHQFNGKKIVAIAFPGTSDTQTFVPPDDVLQMFEDGGHGDIEYFLVKNVRALREVVSFIPLLSKVQSTDPDEVVFYGHCKGVTHASTESVCHAWADAMYETVYNNWEGAKVALEKYGIAGSFKKYGMFKTPKNNRWHYSGTFYWFRSASVFTRNWQYVDRLFYGTESWPGLMFTKEEAACLFHDNTGDLYRETAVQIYEKLEKWKSVSAVQALAQEV